MQHHNFDDAECSCKGWITFQIPYYSGPAGHIVSFAELSRVRSAPLPPRPMCNNSPELPLWDRAIGEQGAVFGSGLDGWGQDRVVTTWGWGQDKATTWCPHASYQFSGQEHARSRLWLCPGSQSHAITTLRSWTWPQMQLPTCLWAQHVCMASMGPS